MKPYPIQFKAEMKERVWGGRALKQFGFEMPEGHIGEAWMIGDHQNGITKAINGELAGMGLDEIRQQYGDVLFGTKGAASPNGRFPLLIKLLDCQDDLSVQVHPDDDYKGLPKGETGKTEMWYILAAKPGAKIIYGLKSEVTREQLTAAIENNQIMDCLKEVTVSAGDSFYIPSGTVHALEAGVLTAEIQQSSDTVYRLYDYNRPGLDGKPRELHVQDALNVIAYDGSGASRMETHLGHSNEWLTLVSSRYFIVEKGKVETSWELETTAESFAIIIICEGTGSIQWKEGSIDAKPGDCFLLPANLGKYRLNGGLTLLRTYIG